MSDINTDKILERLQSAADRFERSVQRGNRRFKGGSADLADDARDFLDREWSAIRRDLADLSSRADISNSPEIRQIVDRIRSAFNTASDSVADVASEARARARQGAAFVDDYVTESPWRSVGVAVLAGVTIGMLISSSRR